MAGSSRGASARPDVTPGWGARGERPRSPRTRSNVEVEVELVRRRAHPDRIELLVPLEIDPLGERVLGEDVALDQKLVVLLDRVERFLEASRHVRDVLELLRR